MGFIGRVKPIIRFGQAEPFCPGLRGAAFCEFVIPASLLRKIGNQARGLVPKILRAERIGRIGPQRRANDGAASGERTSRPPDMQRGDVPMPNAFLATSVRRNPLDR